MKRKQFIFLKSLSALGLVSIFSLGCETKTEGEQKTTAQAGKSDSPVAQQALDAKTAAKNRVDELTQQLDETKKETQAKQQELVKATNDLRVLEDRDVDNKDYETNFLKKLEEQKTQLMDELQTARNQFGVTAQNLREDWVIPASNYIENAEQEFQNLPEFGETNVVGEVLLYTLGLKFLWGIFTGYRTTLFTYKPEFSLNLREKLVEMNEKLTKAQNALEASLADKTYAAINEDLTTAQETIEDALAFFEKNTSAVKTKAVKTAFTAFKEQKLLLANIQKYIPTNQQSLENTKAEIANTFMTQGNRSEEINKTKNKMEQLQASINALMAQERQKTANLSQAKADLAKL